jgi:hypothetical protein
MTGTLHKTETGWIVKYWDDDPHYKGSPGSFRRIIVETEVSKISLTNEYLSTYWVDGREVSFIINPMIRVDGGDEVLIIPDEETWDDIFKNICDQDLTNLNDIWNWLKENYETPKRK